LGAVRRYHYVDLIRGLSALTVLICHYHWLYARFPGDWRTDAALPLYGWLWPIYEHGGIAVEMFWILSGFVFTAAYGRYGKGLSLKAFGVHRFARLYPLHFATLILIAGLEAVSLVLYGQFTIEPNNDLPHFVLQLFFASNWFTMEPSFNGPIWSVSVEVLIYFVFLAYMKRAGLSLPASIGLVVFGGICELVTGSPVALCLCLFFSGVSIGILEPMVQRLLGKWLVAVGAAALLGVIGLGFVADALGQGVHVHMLAVYLGTPAVLILFIALDNNAAPLPKQFHWIGAITYAVYLLHIPTAITLKLLLGDAIYPLLGSPLTLLAWTALVIGLAIPVYYRFELPMQNWIRQWARPEPQASRQAI
jgi:peptidoglycan/LPS O-acetylase OafA/YrhL